MLLRLIDHPRIIELLIYVLECYQDNAQDWLNISGLVFASLLAPIGRIRVALDSSSSLSSLHQLLATMTPSSISIQALIVAHGKERVVNSPLLFIRWLAVLCSILRLMYTIFPEETFLDEIKGLPFNTPTVQCNGLVIKPSSYCNEDKKEPMISLASFLMESMTIGIECIHEMMRHDDLGLDMLSTILCDLLILLQTLITNDYPCLRSALSILTPPSHLSKTLVDVSHCYPLLSLHFTSLLVTCESEILNDWMNR